MVSSTTPPRAFASRRDAPQLLLRLDRVENPIARVAQAGHDELAVVQLRIDLADVNLRLGKFDSTASRLPRPRSATAPSPAARPNRAASSAPPTPSRRSPASGRAPAPRRPAAPAAAWRSTSRAWPSLRRDTGPGATPRPSESARAPGSTMPSPARRIGTRPIRCVSRRPSVVASGVCTVTGSVRKSLVAS